MSVQELWNSKSEGGVFSSAVFSRLLSRASTSQLVPGSGGQSPEARERDLSVFATCRLNPYVSAAQICFSVKCLSIAAVFTIIFASLSLFLHLSLYLCSLVIVPSHLISLDRNQTLSHTSPAVLPDNVVMFFFSPSAVLIWQRNGDDEIGPLTCQSCKIIKIPECTAVV